MTYQNNKPGFTLIEVLLTTALIGIALAPVYSLQNMIMSRVLKTAHAVQAMFIGYDFFLDSRTASVQEGESIEEISEDPGVKLTYTTGAPPKESDVSTFAHIHSEKVSWTWQAQSGPVTEHLFAYHFQPPEEPEKDKKNEDTQQEQKGTQ